MVIAMMDSSAMVLKPVLEVSVSPVKIPARVRFVRKTAICVLTFVL
jgi:hypothetical protein